MDRQLVRATQRDRRQHSQPTGLRFPALAWKRSGRPRLCPFRAQREICLPRHQIPGLTPMSRAVLKPCRTRSSPAATYSSCARVIQRVARRRRSYRTGRSPAPTAAQPHREGLHRRLRLAVRDRCARRHRPRGITGLGGIQRLTAALAGMQGEGLQRQTAQQQQGRGGERQGQSKALAGDRGNQHQQIVG